MSKKMLLYLGIGGLGLVIGIVAFFSQQIPVAENSTESIEPTKTSLPSKTLKTYADPSGFSFEYPDNITLTKKELDNSTYADITLTSKDVKGSLDFKVVDTKLTLIDSWVKENTSVAKKASKVKLGNFDASELKGEKGLLTGAIDKGILFTVEVFFEENQDFWMKVYPKILSSFTFVTPVQESTTPQGQDSSSDEVFFEGEEVVE